MIFPSKGVADFWPRLNFSIIKHWADCRFAVYCCCFLGADYRNVAKNQPKRFVLKGIWVLYNIWWYFSVVYCRCFFHHFLPAFLWQEVFQDLGPSRGSLGRPSGIRCWELTGPGVAPSNAFPRETGKIILESWIFPLLPCYLRVLSFFLGLGGGGGGFIKIL